METCMIELKRLEKDEWRYYWHGRSQESRGFRLQLIIYYFFKNSTKYSSKLKWKKMRLAASIPHSALFGFDSVNSFFHRFVSSRTDGNTFERMIKIQFSEYSSRVYRHSITAMRIDLTSRVARTTKKCFSFEFCPLPSLI